MGPGTHLLFDPPPADPRVAQASQSRPCQTKPLYSLERMEFVEWLASQAGAGEILVSEETCHAADLGLENCETRLLQLKGRSQAVTVRVIRVLEKE